MAAEWEKERAQYLNKLASAEQEHVGRAIRMLFSAPSLYT